MRFVAAGCLTLAVLAARLDWRASPPDLQALAAHFDSLATAENNKPHSDQARYQRLLLISYALGNGAVPGQVAMSIAGRPMPFQIVGIRHKQVYAVGWHDADADTTITVTAPVNDNYELHVAVWRGSTVDSGAAVRPAFNLSATTSQATMAFTTLSPDGTVIASPEVTFGVVRVVLPSDRIDP